jgi:hypothetical protein
MKRYSSCTGIDQMGNWHTSSAICLVAIALTVPPGCGTSAPADAPDAASGAVPDVRPDVVLLPEGGQNRDHDSGDRQPCGPSNVDACPLGFFCTYDNDPWSCGRDGEVGSCAPVLQGCPPALACACDGLVYASWCESAAKGNGPSWAKNCASPDGTFECGTTYCEKRTEVCVYSLSDTNEPGIYHCNPAPGACKEGGPASCECVGPLGRFDQCESTASGDLRITCPWYDSFPEGEGGVAICSWLKRP